MKLSETVILSEICSEYRKLRQDGQNRKDATLELIRRYRNELTKGASDDGLLFWVGLADAQYKHKELTVETAQNALASLDALTGIFPQISQREVTTRRKLYAQAPMSEKSFGKQSRKFRCAWSVGDIFFATLISDEAEKMGIKGGNILYQKIGEIENYDGRIIPIITMTYLALVKEPFDFEEFRHTPPLRMANGRFGSDPTKFEYRAKLLIGNRRQLTSLQYIGNYPVKEPPVDEILFQDNTNMMMVPIKCLEMYGCAFWNVDNYFRKIESL